jgi:hypothetical protein
VEQSKPNLMLILLMDVHHADVGFVADLTVVHATIEICTVKNWK